MINLVPLHLAAVPVTFLWVIQTVLNSPTTSSMVRHLEDSDVSSDFQFTESAGRSTFTLTGSGRERFEQAQPLIEALKHLGILDYTAECASIDIISKQTEMKQQLKSRLTKINLYIRQYDPLPQTAALRLNSVSQTGYSASNNSTASGLHRKSQRNYEQRHTKQLNSSLCVSDSSLKSLNLNDWTKFEDAVYAPLNETEVANETSQGNSSEESRPVHADISLVRSSISDEDDALVEQIGLNKRQVLVISTCSTIIGLFFIVALILRIRNYLNRTRMEKEGLRRHMSRSISITRRIQSHRNPLDTPFNPSQSRLVRAT